MFQTEDWSAVVAGMNVERELDTETESFEFWNEVVKVNVVSPSDDDVVVVAAAVGSGGDVLITMSPLQHSKTFVKVISCLFS